LESEPGDFEQRRRVGFGIVAESEHDGIVHGVFAEAADAGVGNPEQGMPPKQSLQQGLQAVNPDIVATQVNQFVEDHRAQLGGRQCVDE
jgi:hypothetical protein